MIRSVIPGVRVFLLLLIFSLGTYTQAQVLDVLKKNLKEKAKKELTRFAKKEANALKDSVTQRIIDWSEDYDPAELNYAISYSGQSGMYEAENKYESYKRSLVGFAVKPGTVNEKVSDRIMEMNPEDVNRSGELFYITNHFNSAEKAYMTALFLVNQGGQQHSEIDALVRSNLGLLYQTTGRYALAEEYTRYALGIRDKYLDDDAALGASYNNLGVLKKEQGAYRDADNYLSRALDLTLSSTGKESTAYAIILNNMAALKQAMGDYKRATDLQTEAIETATQQLSEKSANVVRMEVNLAMMYQLQGKPDQAEEIYLDAMKLKRHRLGTKHPDYAVMLQNLAGLYLDNGNLEPVEDLLQQAIEIFKDKFGTDHPSYAKALLDKARYYLVVEQPEKAAPLISASIRIQKETLGSHHPTLVESYETDAVRLWMENHIEEAYQEFTIALEEYLGQINRFFPALGESGQAAFWRKVHPKFLRFYSFAMEARQTIPEISSTLYRYHVTTKALLLNTSVKTRHQIRSSGDSKLIETYNQWTDMRRYLGRVYGMTNEQIESDRINVDSLEQAVTQLEKELSARSALFDKQFIDGSVTATKISSLLQPDEAVVDFIRIPQYRYLQQDTTVSYVALVITHEIKVPSTVLFKEGNKMERESLKSYRNAMQWAMEEAPFSKDFWGELSGVTAGKPVIYTAVDGIYNFINLNTLQGDNGLYLIDSKEFRFLNNTGELIKIKRQHTSVPSAGSKAFLLGAPKYDMGFDWDRMKEMPVPELPGTLSEVAQIDKELQTRKWKITLETGEKATEESVKKLQHPILVHLATHGYFLKNVKSSGDRIFGIEPEAAVKNPLLRSGLLLAGADNTIQNMDSIGSSTIDDGILNAYEAMTLDLSGTQLVTLSACETGLGEIRNGEGVYGLLRAFQLAGSQSVMISLWQVSDEVTQKMMELFYKYWLDSGNEQKALVNAQREIKQQYKAPFYWGAFILVK